MVGTARLIDNSGAVIWQSGTVSIVMDYAAGLPVCTPLPCAPSIAEIDGMQKSATIAQRLAALKAQQAA